MSVYKEKPVAYKSGVLHHIGRNEDYWAYNTYLHSLNCNVYFSVPVSDMGDGKFLDQMPAHELIRWLKL